MGKVWALQNAKNRFSEVVERTLRDGPQTVTRHGRQVVVIISAEQYGRLVRPKDSLVEFMRKSPLRGAAIDLDRSGDTGRKIRL